MMIHAYDEIYLNYAMTCLGEAVDYAYYALHTSTDTFITFFISSGLSKQFEKGNVKYICGMSGSELALQAISPKGNKENAVIEERHYYSFSQEFWAGWILAYYQWLTRDSFENIANTMPLSEICNLYNPYHEASEEKVAETISARIASAQTESKLQHMRKLINMSQTELSKASGVNLRTLQQYEIKAKNINKAAVETVLNLCTILHCDIEDIIE